MSTLKRLLREPLFHFLLIGSAVFTLYAAFGDEPSAADPRAIVVTDAKLAQLSAEYEAVWRRPPTPDQLAGLVSDHVREEVFVREALALGLDRDDAVIRRRLRQKMEFLTEAAAGAVEPTETVLRDHYAEQTDRFRVPGRIAFTQVYLGEAPTADAIEAARTALVAGEDPATLGERTLLPSGAPLSPREAVDGTYGRGFFDALGGFEPGMWSGPARSGYGLHLVRVTERVPEAVPPFETVRDAVLRDWLQARVEEIAEQTYLSLRSRYEVDLPDTMAPAGERP